MPDLQYSFNRALAVATASLRDVAKGMGRGYRMLHAYMRGERRITTNAAVGLLRYMRRRAVELTRAADELEAAITSTEEDRDG